MSNKVIKPKKTKLAKDIGDIVDNGFNPKAKSEEELLIEAKYSWDDLNSLKTELGHSVINFVNQVTEVISNKDIINNLGDKLPLFNNIVKTFFADINEFSNRIKELRERHEDRSGLITELDEFTVYNNIAISYHSLFSELSTLVTPSLSELILLSTEAIDNLKAKGGANE